MVDSMSFSGQPLQQTSAPLEWRQAVLETKMLGEKCLEDYGSCNLEKAECIGQQSSQDMTIQKYSLLLSDYQIMHRSADGRQGSLSNTYKERIARIGMETKPSILQWKAKAGNEFTVPAPFQEPLWAQKDLIRRLQNRDNILCRQHYSVGPYYIQFGFSSGQGIGHHAAIVIEIASRLYLPHTVLTFLTQVEAETYSGYSVSMSETALSMEANQLGDTYEADRLAGATLGFIESSSKFPCTTGSVGFLGYGPQFMVLLDDSDEGQIAGMENRTCFGRVVRGMDAIKALQSNVESTIQVAWARILDL